MTVNKYRDARTSLFLPSVSFLPSWYQVLNEISHLRPCILSYHHSSIHPTKFIECLCANQWARHLKYSTDWNSIETKTALSNRELTVRGVTESEEVQYEKYSVLWEWVGRNLTETQDAWNFFLEKMLNLMAHIWRKHFTTNSVLPDYWNKSIWLYQVSSFLDDIFVSFSPRWQHSFTK